MIMYSLAVSGKSNKIPDKGNCIFLGIEFDGPEDIFTGFRRKSLLARDHCYSLLTSFALSSQLAIFMATHFVAVFCEGNNTLTTQYNIFWDLEYF